MSSTTFESAPYPGKPRILFIGLAESTHTHAWIDLLRNAEFNVRLFALPTRTGFPPDEWPVRTYVSGPVARRFDRARRRSVHGPLGRVPAFQKAYRYGWPAFRHLRTPEDWLVQIIHAWQPDIIHTLGLDPAGLFFHELRRQGRVPGRYRWVLQLRGGSDFDSEPVRPRSTPKTGRGPASL